MRADGRPYGTALSATPALVPVLAALTACGYSQTTLPTSNVGRPAAWMSRIAPHDRLLYVSSNNSNSEVYVDVYSYPGGALKGPGGLCVDRAGEVFVPDYFTAKIFEYAHGSASPGRVLQDEPYSYPTDCAISATTGDLAVANSEDVVVFVQGKGEPRSYSDPSFGALSGVGYDDAGNLFVFGWKSGTPGVAEIRKGSAGFTFITVPGLAGKIGPYLGGIKWDGKYVVVGSIQYGDVYPIKIHGTLGRIVATIYLAISPGEFWIPRMWRAEPRQRGDRIIVGAGYQVKVFKYPAGGSPIKTINVVLPAGVAVSPSQS
jgi:hypothetical protein